MDIKTWTRIGYVSVILVLVGIYLFGITLFWNFVLTVAGLSFLASGLIGLALGRRKMSILKRTNPEIIDALRAEKARARAQEKTLSLKEMPPWLIALLIIVTVVGVLGELNAFAFDPMLNALFAAIMVFLVVFYFVYKRKLMKKKYP